MNTAIQLLPEDLRLERSSGRRRMASESIFIPKIVCPPRQEQATWKFGVFGGMHGDEEAGILASHELADWASTLPDELQDFELHIYPVCNPSGRAVGTRHSMGGYDLNREFWVGSSQPEVAYLEGEIRREAYDGLISLHTDDESAGIYGFASGALLSQQILEPALEAAGQIIPRNPSPYIDGFAADRGIITEGYFGVLSAPPEQRPHALEIVFETPNYVRMELQVQATVTAVKTILTEYRRLQAYAPNI